MTTAQREAVVKHGRNLLEIFPEATERDPVELCRKLRRLEARGNAFALRLCNGPVYTEEREDKTALAILDKVNAILRFRETGPDVFLNRDPRGYALKIRESAMRGKSLALHSDWGGYGIIAPHIGKDGH